MVDKLDEKYLVCLFGRATLYWVGRQFEKKGAVETEAEVIGMDDELVFMFSKAKERVLDSFGGILPTGKMLTAGEAPPVFWM